jgi:hypothetical protein
MCADHYPGLTKKISMGWNMAPNYVKMDIGGGSGVDNISDYGFYVKKASGETVADDRRLRARYTNSPFCAFKGKNKQCQDPVTRDKVRYVRPGGNSVHEFTDGETYEFGMRMTVWTDDEIALYWPSVNIYHCCSYYNTK